MSEPKFFHYDLKLVEPAFGSSLTDLIIELDFLRKKRLDGSTEPQIFFQLKRIFHLLESIGSARIEGNNTTLAEYIETKIEQSAEVTSKIQEILNIEEAMDFIDDNVINHPINATFVREIHKKVCHGLPHPPKGEGDLSPGQYRKTNLRINKSDHIPPDFLKVPDYMAELFEFIMNPESPKYDLLKSAIAHHRFVWIHPFCNGNGRTVRLLTYAMLVKQGFNVHVGRIINPTAVFCINRDAYYTHLGMADRGETEGVLCWCEYVIKGIKNEIEKIDRLLDYDYLKKEILIPSIQDSLKSRSITDIESKILYKAVEKQILRACDVRDIFVGSASSEISRQIKKLIEKKMLVPEHEGGRKYLISFENNYLLRSTIKFLGQKGFLPIADPV
jgi:Fic family protein